MDNSISSGIRGRQAAYDRQVRGGSDKDACADSSSAIQQDSVERSPDRAMYSLSGLLGKLFSARRPDASEQAPSKDDSASDISCASSQSAVIEQPAAAADSVAAAVPGPVGAALARQIIAQSDAAATWNDSKVILDRGFRELQGPAMTDPSQKDLAAFGLTALSMVRNDTIAAFLGCHVMKAIANGSAKLDVPGMGSSLKQKSQDARTWKDALEYYSEGFKAIESYDGASPEVREMAKFGREVCGEKGADVDTAMICREIADALEHSSPTMSIPNLAKGLQQRVKNAGTWKEGRDSLRLGFKSIDRYSGSTPQQKQLAAFGRQIVSAASEDSIACTIAGTVLKALESSQPQVAAADIAGIAIKGAHDASTYDGSVKVFNDCFRAVADNPHATDEEKQLAVWGKDVLNLKGDSSVLAKTVECLAESLKSGKPGLDLNAMSTFASRASSSASSWKSARDYVSTVFKTIELSPFAESDVKILAMKGYKDSAAGPDTAEAVKESLKALSDLANIETRRKEAQEEIKKMAENLIGSDEKKDVAIEDDYVDVDGIKLKRRTTEGPEKQ
jgi:hypothetical protein